METSGKESWLSRILGLNMWFGMTLSGWLKLLSKYRFAVERERIPMVVITTGQTLLNSMASYLERVLYEKEVAKTELVTHPIFIIGYWRTGTTHLHNLLCQDERFTCPTTYTCMFPSHFLLTERLMKRLLFSSLPRTRPMDNMRLLWDSPQEDEVALALLGGVSPYMDFAFPNTPEIHRRFLDFEDATK
ncbi:MAG: sulfotransferase, partial [Candidatus Bathyarchaeia archaeon]